MKVAITGGAGFIGANLVRALRLAEPDWQIAVIDDLSTGCRTNLDGVADVIVYEASILNDVALDAAFEVADAVVHLAARTSVQRSVVDPLTTHEVNATGTVRVLDAARRAGVGHVIVASSASVYGDGAAPRVPHHEALAVAPLSPVTMTMRIPARRQRATASATSGRGGSSIPTSPRSSRPPSSPPGVSPPPGGTVRPATALATRL